MHRIGRDRDRHLLKNPVLVGCGPGQFVCWVRRHDLNEDILVDEMSCTGQSAAAVATVPGYDEDVLLVSPDVSYVLRESPAGVLHHLEQRQPDLFDGHPVDRSHLCCSHCRDLATCGRAKGIQGHIGLAGGRDTNLSGVPRREIGATRATRFQAIYGMLGRTLGVRGRDYHASRDLMPRHPSS